MGTSQAQMVVVDFHNKSDNSGIRTTIRCCKYVMFIEFIIISFLKVSFWFFTLTDK